MINWPDPWSKRRSRRSRDRPDEPLEEYEPEEMPVQEGYWGNYGRRVGICALSVAITGFIGIANGGTLSLGGFRGLVYLSFFFIFGVVPAVLPLVWYRDFKRLRAISRRQLDGDSSGDAEPRVLDEESAD